MWQGRPEWAGLAWFNRNGLLLVGENVLDGLLHRGDLLGLFVGDLALEFFFEGHDQLDGIQGVSAQIVHKGGLVLDVRFVHAQLFGDDFLDALYDVIHSKNSFPSGVRKKTLRFYQKPKLQETNP